MHYEIEVVEFRRRTSDAEVRFSPVLREFLRTVNWTYGSVQPTV